ncbi:sugar ABC transporter ATP-binding protein [Halobacteriales archaeon QS_4_62_28]|nr:MAG: sugar ABC transporter ATP-binding protein [Halobacteriales archaeon QS_4_62_28]
MSKLDIKQLRKVYNRGTDTEIVAVDDLSLTVDDGEFLVFVGPSGCGKSTTLRSIAGLEDVTSGSIRIDGRDITGQKPKNRDIAMVFQNYALYPHMTTRENMSFGLRVNSMLDDDEIDARVNEAAKMMGISELLEKRPGTLSGGQQQRVALGRAIVRDPRVFLMDEPLSNLDAKLRIQMRAELETLQNKLGVTTIYVTHDQTEAMTMADRIAVLDDGKLQQIGTPLECYYKPANQFVAEFIGSPTMNFLTVERSGNRLVHDAFEFVVSNDTVDLCGDRTALVMGLRPEDIDLGGDETTNAVSGIVEVIQPTGDDAYIDITIGDDTVTLDIDPEQSVGVSVGEEITVSFDEEGVYLFDPQTEATIKTNTELEPAGPDGSDALDTTTKP